MKLKCFLGSVLAISALAQAETYFWNASQPLNNVGQMGKPQNWSRMPNGLGSWPPATRDDKFDAGIDTVKAWKFIDQDGVEASGKVVAADGKLVLSGQGEDLAKDKHFLTGVKRADIKGTFDVTVRVDSQYAVHEWSKAGIIMANDFSDYTQGGVALVAVTQTHGPIFEFTQSQPAGNLDQIAYTYGGAVTLPIWLRLVKGGTTLKAYYRLDSTAAWIQIGWETSTLGMREDSEIGLFVVSVDSAGKPPKTTTAVFDDFRGGGEIADPGHDYSYDGTGMNSDADVTMSGDFAAHSVDFTGYTGKLTFNSHALSVSGNLRFSPGMQSLDPGAGSLLFTGTAQDTLWPRAGDILPALRKSGSGRLRLEGPATAVSLTLQSGIFDFNNHGLAIGGLAATGGELEGLGADDSLVVSGHADFSGLAAFTMPSGHVIISASGNGAPPTKFNPGGKTFPKLILQTAPTGLDDVFLEVGPGDLIAAHGLMTRNLNANPGFDGRIDFRTHDPAVTVLAGDLTQAQTGSGSNWLALFMGDGIWTCAGNVSLNLQGGGSSDRSTFRLSGASGTQALHVTQGPLFKIEHDGASKVVLLGPLSATDLRQSGGAFDFNGYNLDLRGDLSVTKGGPETLLNLGGRKLTIAGNAYFAGTPAANLGLNPPSTWFLEVGLSLTADSADIANSDAGLGKPGTASNGSKDRGGNTNWSVYIPPDPAIISREPVNVQAKPGWKVSFSLAAQGRAPITYEWRKLGDTTVLSRDTLLMLDSVREFQSGSAWYAVVANADGKDTTRLAYLNVSDCDSLFSFPAGFTVYEGDKVELSARAVCAAEVSWSPVSGPVPKIFDPQVDTLVFTAPRVQGDSTLALSFSARYGANWESGLVTIMVKDTIPDPVAGLDSMPAWSGAAPRAIKARLRNADALAAFPAYPVRYVWAVSPFMADTSARGDSLVLRDPGENGNLEIRVCADNGGTPSCATLVMAVERPMTSIRNGVPASGRLVREGMGLRWHAAGMARIVDWRGRILWQAWGRAGDHRDPSAGAASALRAHAARLEFLAPLRKSP